MQIPLTKGKFALIDDDDLKLVSDYEWRAVSDHGHWYAMSGQGHQFRMHRVIMGATAPKVQVDHINGDGLDNRRANLRLANSQQNQRNRGPTKRNRSGFKGVVYRGDAKTKPWRAVIFVKPKQIQIGYFDTAEEAARAYDQKARELFGEFARLNFEMEKQNGK